MTIKEKRIVINWMLNQIEAMEMANEPSIIGDFKLDQCWAVGSEIYCYGECCGKYTIDVIAEAIGATPRTKETSSGVYKEVEFLGKLFNQRMKDDEAAE